MEFLKLLGTELQAIGGPVPDGGFQRNLDQTRAGGFDNHTGDALSHFAIEIRRREQLSLQAWWADTAGKASLENKVPVVAYRKNNQKWAILVPFYLNVGDFVQPEELLYHVEPVTVRIDGFARIVKHTLKRLKNESTRPAN